MTSLSVKAIDPLTVDFENPGSIKGALLKKLKKKKEELEQNNLDNFVMRNIDKSDLPVLLKEVSAMSIRFRHVPQGARHNDLLHVSYRREPRVSNQRISSSKASNKSYRLRRRRINGMRSPN